MTPIKTKESNFTYLGPTPKVADLPCKKEGDNTFSVWKLSDEERKHIAEGANIRLGIHDFEPIPPVSLEVVSSGGQFQQVDAPCTNCGKGVEDAAHGSGPGTHAYRTLAPAAIKAWCEERIRLGKNSPDDAQIREAMECAETMERERLTPATVDLSAAEDNTL